MVFNNLQEVLEKAINEGEKLKHLILEERTALLTAPTSPGVRAGA